MVYSDPVTTSEMWDMWTKNIVESIEQGLMDDDIKRIARACFARRDKVKGMDPEEVLNQNEQRANVAPPFYEHVNDGRDVTAPAVNTTTQAPAKPVKKATPSRKPRGRRPLNQLSTFRFTDGNLYLKSDVIGKIMQYEKGSTAHVKVRGVGPRAAKVEFVSPDGNPLRLDFVPKKYLVASPKEGGWAVKDPIFMGLDFITPIIKKLTPVKES